MSSSDEELEEDIPKTRTDRALSVHAVRLRQMIKEGRTTQVTIYYDQPIEESSPRESARESSQRETSGRFPGRRKSVASGDIGKQILAQISGKVNGKVNPASPMDDAAAAAAATQAFAASQAAGGVPAAASGVSRAPSMDPGAALQRAMSAGRRGSIRQSITLTTSQINHIATEEEKEAEKREELKERIKQRDAKGKLSKSQRVDREKARVDPTFTQQHRRSVLTLKPGEFEVTEKVAVDSALQLRTKKAMVTLYRRMPFLDRPDDEQTYVDCCELVYELTTIQKVSTPRARERSKRNEEIAAAAHQRPPFSFAIGVGGRRGGAFFSCASEAAATGVSCAS
jgi:hypothetical protein